MSFKDPDVPGPVVMSARGDAEGKPRNQTGWRASCMMMWDTTEGGPCLLRPSGSRAADSPDPSGQTKGCVEGYDENRRPILRQSSADRDLISINIHCLIIFLI